MRALRERTIKEKQRDPTMRKSGKLCSISGVAVGTIVLLLFIGCNNVLKQRHLAEQGVSTLQAAWNRNDCASIYDESDGYFQRNQSRDKWLRTCTDLREQLGTWQSFRVRDGALWPFGSVGIVWVEGPADFAGGLHTLRADFALEDNTARLFNLQFDLNGKLIQIPGFSGRLVD
jgi:hypothetical protein